jgi:dephospho-CoA kinase
MRIILAGRAGSGKSTIGDYLASVYGFRTYSFADKIKEIALELFPESFKNERKPRQLLQELGDNLRALDPQVWESYLFAKIESEKPRHAVITDCRLVGELNSATENNFIPVWVDCKDDVRVRRLIERDKVIPTIDELNHETEQDLQPEMFKFSMDNSNHLFDTFEQIDKLVFQLENPQLLMSSKTTIEIGI